MDNRTLPITGTTATTPARAHNCAADRLLVSQAIAELRRIGYDSLCRKAAAEAEAARQVALDDGANQDSIIHGGGDTTNGRQQHTG